MKRQWVQHPEGYESRSNSFSSVMYHERTNTTSSRSCLFFGACLLLGNPVTMPREAVASDGEAPNGKEPRSQLHSSSQAPSQQLAPLASHQMYYISKMGSLASFGLFQLMPYRRDKAPPHLAMLKLWTQE